MALGLTQRDGGQAQCIGAPMPDLHSSSLFAGTVDWLQEHLDEPNSRAVDKSRPSARGALQLRTGPSSE